jgi:hypothetical protein
MIRTPILLGFGNSIIFGLSLTESGKVGHQEICFLNKIKPMQSIGFCHQDEFETSGNIAR